MTWKNAVKNALEGLAYAHFGDFLPWEEKCRILDVEESGETMGSKARREVALLLGHTLTPPLLDYVIYSCQCLEAGLTILVPPALTPRDTTLSPHLARLAQAKIVPRIVPLPADGTAELVRYLHRHSEVIFVVVGTRDASYRPLYEPVRGTPRWRLDVPVVVVKEEEPLPAPAS